jgi:hypothetical protein
LVLFWFWVFVFFQKWDSVLVSVIQCKRSFKFWFWASFGLRAYFCPNFAPQTPPIGTVFFARGISLGQKWWKDKFHAANGKAEACTQGALLYVLLSFAEGGVLEGFFFIFPWFPMCSHYVPFKFPMGSHQVPNTFFKFSMHAPNMFSIASHFYPLCFRKRCPPFTILPFPSISVGRKWWKTYEQIKIVTSQWTMEHAPKRHTVLSFPRGMWGGAFG